jgi:glutamate N-acetyltransferase / amino-acid N-acetyltransferase
MKIIPNGGVTSANGFIAAGVTCGLKASGKPDFALLASKVPAISECATTTNLFAAAPVFWCRKVHALGKPVYGVAVNSGTANAATGKQGEKNAKAMAEITAKALHCNPGEVYIASTGVIGRQLPMDKIEYGIKLAAAHLAENGGPGFARAIMTTDLVAKEVAVGLKISGKDVTIGGCCKGSGMIHPRMATMLAFVTTDSAIARPALKKAFNAALGQSFNRVTVDGDTSTNDMVALLANGAAGNRIITGGKSLADFTKGLTFVFRELAKKIARDGEGATKLVTIRVQGAKTETDADKAARAIAHSPLVKTALFGNDPNWGRIMAAVGYSGIFMKPEKSDLHLCGIPLVKKGEPLSFDAQKAHRKLKEKTVNIVVDLHLGKGAAEIFTCDLSYDYVKINAEYHT